MTRSLRSSLVLAIAVLCGTTNWSTAGDAGSPDYYAGYSGGTQQPRGLLAGRSSNNGSSQLASWSLNNGANNDSSLDQWMGGGSCDTCSDCCPDPLWCHRSSVFFDFLYLRPGNIDYVYAVEKTGTLSTDSPTGPVGRVGFDGHPGYRFGLTHAMSDCSSIQATYTWFQADTQSAINAAGSNVLIFQPGDPSIPNVGSSSIASSARYDIRFQQLDLDYRSLLWGDCNSALNYFAGLRYANLKQTFHAQEDIGVPVGLSTVNTEINFDGIGIGAGDRKSTRLNSSHRT